MCRLWIFHLQFIKKILVVSSTYILIHADVVHRRRNTWEYGAFIYTTAAAIDNAINRLLANLSLNLSCLNVITLQGAE